MISVEIQVRVRYAEVDQMRAAHHTAYLVWFELARGELLRSVGVPYGRLEAEGVLFPVVGLDMRYLAPARYDDEVVAETTLTRVSHVRVSFSYRLRSRESGELLAEGNSTHACVDRGGKPRRLPPELKSRLVD